MSRRKLPATTIVLGGLLLLSGLGCVTVKAVAVDRRTALENQILGSFERLDRDLVLASAVRGGSAGAPGSPLEQEALAAMVNRAFNRDDIDELKQRQLVGEGRDGLLVLLPPKGDGRQAPDAEAARLWATAPELVAEENRDREVIMRRVLSADGSLEERDAPLVRRIFYRLNSQAARPGDRVQREDGSWEVRAGGTESKGQRTGEQDAGDRRQATGNQG